MKNTNMPLSSSLLFLMMFSILMFSSPSFASTWHEDQIYEKFVKLKMKGLTEGIHGFKKNYKKYCNFIREYVELGSQEAFKGMEEYLNVHFRGTKEKKVLYKYLIEKNTEKIERAFILKRDGLYNGLYGFKRSKSSCKDFIEQNIDKTELAVVSKYLGIKYNLYGYEICKEEERYQQLEELIKGSSNYPIHFIKNGTEPIGILDEYIKKGDRKAILFKQNFILSDENEKTKFQRYENFINTLVNYEHDIGIRIKAQWFKDGCYGSFYKKTRCRNFLKKQQKKTGRSTELLKMLLLDKTFKKNSKTSKKRINKILKLYKKRQKSVM